MNGFQSVVQIFPLANNVLVQLSKDVQLPKDTVKSRTIWELTAYESNKGFVSLQRLNEL